MIKRDLQDVDLQVVLLVLQQRRGSGMAATPTEQRGTRQAADLRLYQGQQAGAAAVTAAALGAERLLLPPAGDAGNQMYANPRQPEQQRKLHRSWGGRGYDQDLGRQVDLILGLRYLGEDARRMKGWRARGGAGYVRLS